MTVDPTTALRTHWGIEGAIHPLPGEFDLNYRVQGRDGAGYVLKVMRPDCDRALVDLMISAHDYIHAHGTGGANVPVARVVPTPAGDRWSAVSDEAGRERIAWLLTLLEGREYARTRERSLTLMTGFGAEVARLHAALAGFAHPALARDFKWDLRRAGWISRQLHVHPEGSRRSIITSVIDRFAKCQDAMRAQPTVVLHNDLNDWNLLVARDDAGVPRISGIIDFGDIIDGPVVAELAIAGAYLVLDHPTPLRALAAFVAGYHAVTPLTGEQLDLVWPLLLMRLAVSVTNSAMMQRERPNDLYVVVSQRGAWRFLERYADESALVVAARLRAACGFPATDAAARVVAWFDSARGSFAPVMGRSLADVPQGSISVKDSAIPRNPLAMTADEARVLGRGAGVGEEWVGSYGEPRAVYTAPAFRNGPHATSDRRSVHLGVDIFMAAGTPVHAPTDAVIDTVEYRESALDYGGMVVLRHATPAGDPYWTLYGHLSRASVASLAAGTTVAAGDRIAELGDMGENGGWDPHLHLQLALSIDGMGSDWPGVASPDDWGLWRALCPNPAALLNLPNAAVAYRPIDEEGVRAHRREHFATNLRLSYRDPCLFVRGSKHYLLDEWGRLYLDAYNNVPHVGHAHPRLQAVAADQLARLNTNTRYLHPALRDFADELLREAPPHLTHVFLVNSGSEANELALRLARTATGGRDMIVADHGYHGNTTGAYDLSAYKFNKPRGGGPPEWVQVVPVADTYRGEHRGADAAERYASFVDGAVQAIAARGGRLAGFIAETFPSVAGQIIPPPGYLAGVYARVRAAGGICIADEVQTGLGRLGDYYWAFEQQGVLPDVVVLGKPLGNGHPIGAVLTTGEIARAFDNGIEFFSTFGGSTLSCRVGTEVLRIVREEGLQANARDVGAKLLSGLRELQARQPLIGDVRGIGLFVGVELVTDRESRAPGTAVARHAVNRLREERILIGTEGPADNVLKIRPPLTLGRGDAELIVSTLGRVLEEWE